MENEKRTEEDSVKAAASSRPMHLQKAATYALTQAEDMTPFPGKILKIAAHRFDILVMAILAEANGNNIAGWATFLFAEAQTAMEQRGYQRAESEEDEETTEEETTEEEDSQPEPPDDPTDRQEAKVAEYTELMHHCFDGAMAVMEMAELVGEVGELDKDLKTRIALKIFDRATMVPAAQDKIFEAGLEFLCLLMKEKEADRKREEELRGSMPVMRGTFGMASFSSSAMCAHPGLHALYDYMTGTELDGDVNTVVEDIVSNMTVGGPTIDDPGFLFCGFCRALIPVDKFKTGELWSEAAGAAREEAREADPYRARLAAGHDAFGRDIKAEPGDDE